MQRRAFQLQRILIQRLAVLDDGADMAEWGDQIADGLPVAVGIVQAQDIIDALNPFLSQVAFQVAVIHHQLSTPFAAPGS
ncbi:hypothetical protein D3C76_1717410 [compost metagenome]